MIGYILKRILLMVPTLLGALTVSATPEELADNWQRVAQHFDLLLDRKLVDAGDLVIVTKGELSGVQGGTNSLKILEVRRDL